MPLTICRLGLRGVRSRQTKEQADRADDESTAGVQVLCSNPGTSSYSCMGLPYSMCARPKARRRRRGYGPRCNNPRQSDALAKVVCTCTSLILDSPKLGGRGGGRRQIDIHHHKRYCPSSSRTGGPAELFLPYPLPEIASASSGLQEELPCCTAGIPGG